MLHQLKRDDTYTYCIYTESAASDRMDTIQDVKESLSHFPNDYRSVYFCMMDETQTSPNFENPAVQVMPTQDGEFLLDMYDDVKRLSAADAAEFITDILYADTQAVKAGMDPQTQGELAEFLPEGSRFKEDISYGSDMRTADLSLSEEDLAALSEDGMEMV